MVTARIRAKSWSGPRPTLYNRPINSLSKVEAGWGEGGGIDVLLPMNKQDKSMYESYKVLAGHRVNPDQNDQRLPLRVLKN